jgi:NNP family nitrate/nitrite transporter-like MFS transporter
MVSHSNKATRIALFDFHTPQMRAFHMTWSAFFLCFFAWFGLAPLMGVIRDEFSLSKAQLGNIIIASVAVTVLCRLVIGWLCDRIGPRYAYAGLLILGSLPVIGIAFAHDFWTFLLFRLAIGGIGASFVITQYHTSVMFAPNCVGTANATTAGWGNLGGGVTQLAMPLIYSAFLSAGFSTSWGWRASMMLAGAVCALWGVLYLKFTQDTPEGNFNTIHKTRDRSASGGFLVACRDYRVWALFVAYGACFGIELTMNNIAALYFIDYFGLGMTAAGAAAACFGLMNLFARTLGGVFGDHFGIRYGLKGRVRWLTITLAGEGIALIAFSQSAYLPVAMGLMILFSLFVQMSEGATYSVVPFINKHALGSVVGIVGAGGNAGAIAAGVLFKQEMISWPQALQILGVAVTLCAGVAATVRFSAADEAAALQDLSVRTSPQPELAQRAA